MKIFQVLFDFQIYLEEARKNTFIIHQLDRVYLSGALLTIGDALSKNHYFDKSPIIELLRHLRNGIAHGNKFNIGFPEKLLKFPAHDKVAKNHNPVNFEITPELDGTNVLFDFMEPGDILNVFHQVGFHLKDLAYGMEK